jgi:hypothetical protein
MTQNVSAFAGDLPSPLKSPADIDMNALSCLSSVFCDLPLDVISWTSMRQGPDAFLPIEMQYPSRISFRQRHRCSIFARNSLQLLILFVVDIDL